MDRRNIAAFTPPGSHYPPYVSINDTGTLADPKAEGVEITVRSPPKPDGSCGDCSTILLSRSEFAALMREVWKDAQWPRA